MVSGSLSEKRANNPGWMHRIEILRWKVQVSCGHGVNFIARVRSTLVLCNAGFQLGEKAKELDAQLARAQTEADALRTQIAE